MQTSHKLIGLLTAAALTAVLGLVLSQVVISLAATSGEEFMQLCEVAPRALNDLIPFLFASSVLVVFGALLFGAGRVVKTGVATVAAIGVGLLVFVTPPQTANAAPSCLYVDGSNAMLADLNMGGFDITNLAGIEGASLIFNTAQGDYDFTVRTQNNTQTFVVDGGTDQVRMGGNLIADTGRLLVYQKPSIFSDGSPSHSWWTSGTTTVPEAAAYTETYGAYFGQTTWAGVAGGAAESIGTASTVYIAGPAVQGANITLTTPRSLTVASGTSWFGGNLQATAATGSNLYWDTATHTPTTVQGTGRLGIGTTTPLLPLHVKWGTTVGFTTAMIDTDQENPLAVFEGGSPEIIIASKNEGGHGGAINLLDVSAAGVFADTWVISRGASGADSRFYLNYATTADWTAGSEVFSLGKNGDIIIQTFAANAVWYQRTADGTSGAPTATPDERVLMALVAQGYATDLAGANPLYRNGGILRFVADEAWGGATGTPTRFEIQLVPPNSLSVSVPFRISSEGFFAVGAGTPAINGAHGFSYSPTLTFTAASGRGFFLGGTYTGIAGSTTVAGLAVAPNIVTAAAADVHSSISSLRILEPSITLGSGSSVTVASTIHIVSVPTEGSDNVSIWDQVGPARFDGGFKIGSSANALFDDASNGAGSTTMYIGTNTINTTAPSDGRLKNILGVANVDVLSAFKGLVPYRYTYAYDDSKVVHTGYLAQDVQKVLPSLVSMRSDGHLQIDYGSNEFGASLIRAIQQQQEQIDDLKARLAALEASRN